MDGIDIPGSDERHTLLIKLGLLRAEAHGQIVLLTEEHGDGHLNVLVGIDNPARRQQCHALQLGDLQTTVHEDAVTVERRSRQQSHTVAA